MNAYKIANILYNMGLDAGYEGYRNLWETEILALEEEIFKLKTESKTLFYMLEMIAFHNEKFFDLHTKTDEEIEEVNKKHKQTACKEVMYEDNEGNYRYRGFWSGFGDQ